MKAASHLILTVMAACLLPSALAQSPYQSPRGYGATAAPAAASPQGQTLSPPQGRPAPAQPMPTPLPQTDKVQSAIDTVAPMSADEITKLLRMLFERQSAGRENVTGRPPPKPVTSVETLDLSPNSVPPVIRLALGQGTVLSFSDAAGRPWPIMDNLNFNDRAYTVKLIGPHLYSITLKSMEPANVTVVLKDLARPIVITVLPATDETDYLKEYTVPRFIGGEAPASVAASSRDGGLSFNSAELINFLYRTPPKEAKPLTIAGLPGVLAWQTAGNKMVVRTSGQVVIPAFSRRHASTDGIAVYEVPLSPVISITEGGTLYRVSIGGYSVEAAGAGSGPGLNIPK
jgi:intracellular multiplication protein IcmK